MAIYKFRIICLLIPVLLFFHSSYAQFTDDFSDGNFTTNPVWQGDTSHFTINAGKQLQSNATSSGTIYLSTLNQKVLDAEWQFWINLKFNPSDQNYVKIYLSSDNANLSGSLNGYFIRIGETLALDGIDLYRQNGTTVTPLINGIDAHGAINPVLRIKVIHRSNGDWELYSDITGNNNFNVEGTANDNSFSTLNYFKVSYKLLMTLHM